MKTHHYVAAGKQHQEREKYGLYRAVLLHSTIKCNGIEAKAIYTFIEIIYKISENALKRSVIRLLTKIIIACF